ncbi:MAG: hypothetical protein RIC55_09260 [Pirellulaceae bacterium]
MFANNRLAVATLFGGLVASYICSASDEATSDERRDEAYLRVQRLRAEIDLLRVEMGCERAKPLPLHFANASRHDVHYQVRILVEKLQRLAEEWGQEVVPAPNDDLYDAQQRELSPLLDAAQRRVESLKAAVGVEHVSPPAPHVTGEHVAGEQVTEDELFEAVVAANRQINRLFDAAFAPRDVYRQVTVCVAYASSLLAPFPSATRIPPEPAFEHAKRPTDVFRRLLECYDILHGTCARRRISILEIRAEGPIDSVAPSEVYDLAGLLASQLARLDGLVNHQPTTRCWYTPGRKLPSHVFQRVGLLERQLLELDAHVDDNPQWPNLRLQLP